MKTPTKEISDLRVTNVASGSFSVVWTTDEPDAGMVKVYTNADDEGNLFYDDRDVEEVEEGEIALVSTGMGDYTAHHVTVAGVDPETVYMFRVVDEAGNEYKLTDAPAWPEVTTTSIVERVTTPEPVYGRVTDEAGNPVKDAVVLLQLMADKETPLSTQVSTLLSSTGSYSLDISNVQAMGGEGTVKTSEVAFERITVVSNTELTNNVVLAPSDLDQPVPDIKVGVVASDEAMVSVNPLVMGVNANGTVGMYLSADSQLNSKCHVKDTTQTDDLGDVTDDINCCTDVGVDPTWKIRNCAKAKIGQSDCSYFSDAEAFCADKGGCSIDGVLNMTVLCNNNKDRDYNVWKPPVKGSAANSEPEDTDEVSDAGSGDVGVCCGSYISGVEWFDGETICDPDSDYTFLLDLITSSDDCVTSASGGTAEDDSTAADTSAEDDSTAADTGDDTAAGDTGADDDTAAEDSGDEIESCADINIAAYVAPSDANHAYGSMCGPEGVKVGTTTDNTVCCLDNADASDGSDSDTEEETTADSGPDIDNCCNTTGYQDCAEGDDTAWTNGFNDWSNGVCVSSSNYVEGVELTPTDADIEQEEDAVAFVDVVSSSNEVDVNANYGPVTLDLAVELSENLSCSIESQCTIIVPTYTVGANGVKQKNGTREIPMQPYVLAVPDVAIPLPGELSLDAIELSEINPAEFCSEYVLGKSTDLLGIDLSSINLSQYVTPEMIQNAVGSIDAGKASESVNDLVETILTTPSFIRDPILDLVASNLGKDRQYLLDQLQNVQETVTPESLRLVQDIAATLLGNPDGIYDLASGAVEFADTDNITDFQVNCVAKDGLGNVIGDFTTTVGDFSDASSTRPSLLTSNLMMSANAQSEDVTNELGYINPGGYELSSTNVLTKNISVVEPGKVMYFYDTNENGIKDTDESYVLNIDDMYDISFKKVAEVQSYRFAQGWNAISFPMLLQDGDNANVRTAGDLLALIREEGYTATHVTTYRAGQFVVYSERLGNDGELITFGDDFNLLPGEGYFIKSYSVGNFAVTGRKVEGSLEVQVDKGWNLVGIYNEPNASYGGFEVMNQMSGQGLQADTLSKYEGGLYSNLVVQDSTEYGNDFRVFPYSGYWVNIEGDGGKYKPE